MNGEIPNASNVTQPQQTPSVKGKKRLLFEIVFVVVFLIILFGILNYFNILPLSKLFRDQLGFLPRRDVPTGTSQQPQQPSNVTLSPGEQAKQALINFLPTILNPSVLPKSDSDISLKQNEGLVESFSASWNVEEGTVSAILVLAPEYKNIVQSYLSLSQTENVSPSVELAQTTTSQFFLTQPKGKWGCKPIYINTMTFCENFWEEESGERLGLGIIGVSPEGSNLVFFCQHNKNSKLYSWKSCEYEFAQTGVTP